MRIASVEIDCVRIDKTLELPEYASELSAGADVRASFHSEIDNKSVPVVIRRIDGSKEEVTGDYSDQIILNPGDRALIPIGLLGAIPGEAQIRPRSGLAWKYGITVINSPGTIDADYRDSIGVILINHGHEPFTIKHGDRIAQMVFSEIKQIKWNELESKSLLDSTNRGGGIGHSGVK